MKLANVSITGIASFLPDEKITNENIVNSRPKDIAPEDWTDNQWIVQRTGIEERRRAPKNWGSVELMVEAAKKLLCETNKTIDKFDLLVVSTSFSQNGSNIPRTAEEFKAQIGAPQSTLSVGEDAECAGFVWAMIRAQMEMTCFGFKRAMVVSGDKTTAFTNSRDRKTCGLFGDGACALMVERCKKGFGMLASYRATNTEFINAIKVPAGGSAMPLSHFKRLTRKNRELFTMQMPGGKEMLHYIGKTGGPEACRKVCEASGICIKKLTKVFPHQANLRMTNQMEGYLDLDDGVMFKETQRIYGNTSGSSGPIGMDFAYRKGLLDYGDYFVVDEFGAGFIIGSFLGRWTMQKFQE